MRLLTKFVVIGALVISGCKPVHTTEDGEKPASPTMVMPWNMPGGPAYERHEDLIHTNEEPSMPEQEMVQNEAVRAMQEKQTNQRRYKVGKAYKIKGKTYQPREKAGYSKIGYASWYGEDFHGKLTANGEIYDMERMTAAHPTLALPSVVKVTNITNGKSVVVRVNDRGPFAQDRIIDLSRKAARELGFIHDGIAQVHVELLPKETAALFVRPPAVLAYHGMMPFGKPSLLEYAAPVPEIKPENTRVAAYEY